LRLGGKKGRVERWRGGLGFGDAIATVYDAVGNPISTTNAFGFTTQYVYDTMNQEIAEVDPLPLAGDAQGVTSLWIPGQGLVVCSGGPTTTWQYDANGNVTAVTDPLGNTISTVYNDWNEAVAVTNALGNTTTTTYDELGRVSLVTDAMGRSTEYLYDNLGRKIEEIDADPASGVASATDPNCPKTYYGYDADGNLACTTGPLGAYAGDPAHTTWYFYDGLNRQTCVVNALADTTYSSDVTPATQPSDSEMTQYDALGDVIATTDELGRTTAYVFDNLGRQIEEIDADGHTSWTDYDALNRVVKSVSALGNGPTDTQDATTTVYNAVGSVISVTDSDGNLTLWTYDDLGRKIEQSETAALGYGAGGTIQTTTATTSYQYDHDGNLTQSTDADGRMTQFVYDPLGRQVAENWLNSSRSIIHSIDTYYDADGETIGVTEWDLANPSSCTDYEYTYDADGDMLSSRMAPGDLAQTASATVVPGTLSNSSGAWDWQGNGQSVNVAFTTLSNLAAGNLFLTVSSAAFDPTLILLPSSAVSVSGSTITGVNWSQGIVVTDNGGIGSANLLQGVAQGSTWYVAVTCQSQAQGSYNLTWIDNAYPIVPTALTELDYAYYADGSVHTVTDSSNVAALSGNTATTTYAYDVLSRVASIAQSGSGASTKQVNFTYYANSQVETVTSTSGASQVATGTYSYDGDERLTGLSYTHNGSAITITGGSAITYGVSYDAASNITQVVSADGTDNYGLDSANELTSASLAGESYTYDANGNRVGGGYVTAAGNRMLSDGTYYYQYDADGNGTARYKNSGGDEALDSTATSITIYTWDYENRLTQETNYLTYAAYQAGTGSATQIVTYTFDYQGNMIRRGLDVGGTTTYTYTVYNGQNPYLQVSDANHLAGGGATAAISQRYLYGQAVDQILGTDNGGGNVLWGLADYEGTIRDVVNTSGAEVSGGHVQFDSFGNAINGTAPLADYLFGLNGMRYDPATTDYLTETVPYDPSTGQRLSQDPLGFASGTTNFTAWAGNNAVENTDPSGEVWGWVSDSWYYASAVGVGIGQGALNIVNGVQDAGVAVLNTPAAVWNNTAGALGASQAGYINSPDWSKDKLVPNDPLHDASKFVGGQSAVTLLTLGASNVTQGCALATRAGQVAQVVNNTQMAAQTFGSAVRTGNAIWDALQPDQVAASFSRCPGAAVRSTMDKLLTIGKEAVPAILNIAIARATSGAPSTEAPNGIQSIAKAGDFGPSASGSQEILDEVIASDPALQNVELSVQPQYNPNLLNAMGKTTRGGGLPTEVEIGPKSFVSQDELVDTIVHEELHVRTFDRAMAGSETALDRVLDPAAEEAWVRAVTARFLGFFGR
jgi:RHS repeat-associated protein